MAEILKARDITVAGASIVAVKRILPHLTDDRQYVMMFLDESRVLAQLEHENIIHTLEVGQVGDTPFIAIEYVFGQDARMLFHRARRSEQPVPLGIACYIIAQSCAGLHHAHEHKDASGNLLGLVHRDVSLQNILLSYEGAVKLTDFGIAMSTQNRARTEAGIVKGKFGYMSPEQIKGEPMDRRSDVFAAGICLYELLTSERLFSGESDYAAVEKVRNVVIEPPSRINREVPSTLEAIVMKALARHPRDRFQSAADMRRALLSFMAESHRECSAKELADCMRSVFAEELIRQPTPEALRRETRPRRDEPTGLAAFDHLDPVSTISGPSAVYPTPDEGLEPDNPRGPGPSVPPVVPRRDSVPVGRGGSDVFPRPEMPSSIRSAVGEGPMAEASELGWEGEQLAGATERLPPLALDEAEYEPGDDDVTRQVYLAETLSGLPAEASFVRASSPPMARAPVRSGYAPVATPEPTAEVTREPVFESALLRPTPQASYGTVVGIVVAIVTLIAGALYLTRGARPAEVHLATAPLDAEVRVDGRRAAGNASPFVLADLTPERSHRIEVARGGYRSWSTRLTLRSGQVLELPLVTLEPEPASPAVPSPATLAAAPTPAPTEVASPTPADVVKPAPPPKPASTEAHESRPSPKLARPAGQSAPAPEKPVRVARASDTPAVKKTPRPLAPQASPGAGAPAPAGGGAHKPSAAPAPPIAAGKGVLRINSRPWSELTIDGRPAGTTPQMNLQLPAGTHTVKLKSKQFGLTKTIKVKITAGETLTQVVNLQ